MILIPAGDSSLLVSFGEVISEDSHLKVRSLAEALQVNPPSFLLSLQPSYASLLIKFDLTKAGHPEVEQYIKNIDSGALRTLPTRKVEVPVCYEAPCAPDLEDVVEHTKLERKEVIRLHSSASYKVYFLGFMPGFPYLGGMPAELETPRLPSPRAVVPPGSVGIAGKQTGIYPIKSPGGWRLIGRTPLKLFDPSANKPCLFSMGDEITFKPISLDEFQALGGIWDK